jgi:sec-independent protein translocase protein TatC
VSSFSGVVEGFRARSGEATFLDRLDDVRGRLISSLVVLLVLTVAGFYVAMSYDVLGIFTAPIQPYLGGERLKYLSPTTPFFITLKMGVCLGFAAALPYLLRQVWAVFAPLMRPEEKRLMRPAVFAAFLLFSVGVVFCYYLVLPVMLGFTMNFQTASLEQSIVIEEYLTLTLRMLIAFGAAFELPIVILLGTVLGLVTPELLRSNRRYAIAIILVVCAIVTPPDIGSLLLMVVPVLLLYEASIVMAHLILSRRSTESSVVGA